MTQVRPDKPQPTPDLRSFGHEVARLRKERGWSIDLLAEKVGVDRRTIINLEGAHKTPRADTIHDLAHALGIGFGPLLAPICSGHAQAGLNDNHDRSS